MTEDMKVCILHQLKYLNSLVIITLRHVRIFLVVRMRRGTLFFFLFFFSMTILQNAWIQQIASIASYMMYPD